MTVVTVWTRTRWTTAALALLTTSTPGFTQSTVSGATSADTAVDKAPFKPSRSTDKEKILVPGRPQKDHLEAGHTDVYPLQVAPMQRVEINATSDDLDMVLKLYDRNDALIGENDDGGQNNNAKLIFQTPPGREARGATYYVVASTMTKQQAIYEISALVRDAPPSAPPSPIAAGQEIAGVLDENSAIQGVEGQPYADYRLMGTTGERIRLTLDSDDFDSKLELRDGSEMIGSDDDGGEGTNARLTRTLTKTGPLDVRVIAGSGKRGRYKLALAAVPLPAAEPQIDNIRFGEVVSGELGDASALLARLEGSIRQVNIANARSNLGLRLQDGCLLPSTRRPYRLYRLSGKPDDTATITWTTSTGRCGLLVEIGVDSPAGFATLYRWSVGNTATVRFGRAGELMLRVSVNPDQAANFQLRVSDATRPPPPVSP